MTKLLTTDEINQKIFEKHGNKISLVERGEVLGDKYKFVCNACGYIWETTLKSVIRNNPTGCYKCGRNSSKSKLKHNISYVKSEIEKRGCYLLSSKYNNVNEKLDVKFSCGHVGKISFECFRRGHRCSICGRKNMGLSQRLSQEKIEEILKQKNLEFLEYPNGYVNRNSKMTHRCSIGHIETRSMASVMSSDGCVQCSRIRSSISQIGELGNNWKGGTQSLTSFLKKQIKFWKKESIKASLYSCVICKDDFDDVHHLHSFYSIISESLEELKIERKDNINKYSREDLEKITFLMLEKHDKYGHGVCLCRKHHKEFHHIYGLKNNTEYQFREFEKNFCV